MRGAGVPCSCGDACGVRVPTVLALTLVAVTLPSTDGLDPCTLVSLSVRYNDWPVELEPPFRHYIYDYEATLDFSMKSFSVDARPDYGCQVDGVPGQAIPIQIGGSAAVSLFARHPASGERKKYVIKLTRLLGSETELKSLVVDGGSLAPMFDPTVRKYIVRMDVDYDEIVVKYRLRDNEQRIRSSCTQQQPTGTEESGPKKDDDGNSNNSSSGGGDSKTNSDGGGHERRLVGVAGIVPESGEVQFVKSISTFMLDVGFSRSIELTVQCADAQQANIGTYTMSVMRPGCTPSRPYFDPDKRVCVNFCPAGYYRNPETHRCSKCNANCKVCDSLLDCRMCIPDTADYNYLIQPDGRCLGIANHLFKKYRWWCIGLGILLFFLLLVGCVLICQLCCTSAERLSSSRSKGGKVASSYDSDDSDGPPVYANTRGRLAMY